MSMLIIFQKSHTHNYSADESYTGSVQVMSMYNGDLP